jgi:hypothetical protein
MGEGEEITVYRTKEASMHASPGLWGQYLSAMPNISTMVDLRDSSPSVPQSRCATRASQTRTSEGTGRDNKGGGDGRRTKELPLALRGSCERAYRAVPHH